jgi:hypothetical protein
LKLALDGTTLKVIDKEDEIKELNDDQRVMRINRKYLKKYKPMLQEIRIAQE